MRSCGKLGDPRDPDLDDPKYRGTLSEVVGCAWASLLCGSGLRGHVVSLNITIVCERERE